MIKPALVVVGLGNPGATYAHTRHNAGFQAVDALSDAFGEGEWSEKQKFQSEVKEGRIVAAPILFVKPHTFMNLSGEAIRKIIDFYKLDAKQQLLVLCDDIDIPLGTTRLRMKGGPGTHNGLKSIVETVGENFPRLRIGIGPKPATGDLGAWVLSRLTTEESATLSGVFAALPEALKTFVLEAAE